MKHVSVTVYGKVQGVFFRASAQEAALQYGVKGFVKNQSDGSVYIEAEGEDAVLDRFIAWCHQGPPQARVDRVEVVEGNFKSFASFDVKRW
jgi:acylphosphatase